MSAAWHRLDGVLRTLEEAEPQRALDLLTKALKEGVLTSRQDVVNARFRQAQLMSGLDMPA